MDEAGGRSAHRDSCLGATLVGAIAVLLWATLALFTTVAVAIPPFELVALTFSVAYLPGYLAALGCAFTWSGYSLLSRRLGRVPSDAVGGFCGVTALLGLIVHLATELTVWPGVAGWSAVLALGLGPVGIAFFV